MSATLNNRALRGASHLLKTRTRPWERISVTARWCQAEVNCARHWVLEMPPYCLHSSENTLTLKFGCCLSLWSGSRAMDSSFCVGLTVTQLCSFHMPARVCSKSFKLGFSSTWTENFQMYKLGLENTEEPNIKLATFAGSQKKQGHSRKISTSVSLTMLKPLTVWITTNCGKFLKKWEY